jgi:hypothetical protein
MAPAATTTTTKQHRAQDHADVAGVEHQRVLFPSRRALRGQILEGR